MAIALHLHVDVPVERQPALEEDGRIAEEAPRFLPGADERLGQWDVYYYDFTTGATAAIGATSSEEAWVLRSPTMTTRAPAAAAASRSGKVSGV